MHLIERGTGLPVLAIHGWTPDHRLMLGCLEPLFARRPGYRRLYPDLPGMGLTPAPESIASSDDILDALDDLVDKHIGTAPFLLIGESYGGYLARALTRRRPGQVLGLALICPIGTAVEHAERNVPPHQTLRLDPAVGTPAGDFLEMAVVATPQTLQRYLEDVQPGLDAADTVAMARIRQRWVLTDDPEGGAPYERPALILAGRQDASVGYVDQFALMPHYPRATYVVLDVAGHNLQFERPALFETLMSDWLDRVAEEA